MNTTLKRALKDNIDIVMGNIKRLQYLPALWQGPGMDRNQNYTLENFEQSWGETESIIERRYLTSRIIFKFGNKWIRAPLIEAIKRFIKLQREAIDQEAKGAKLSILEVGAGFGQILYTLAASRPQHKFSGIEYTQAGVDGGKRFWPSHEKLMRTLANEPITWPPTNLISFERGDGRKLPFPDKHFDISYTNAVLEQIPNPEDHRKIFSEMRRVTRLRCHFLEPWKEAQSLLDMAYLRHVDYFRASIQTLRDVGFKDVTFRASDRYNTRFGSGFVTGRP